MKIWWSAKLAYIVGLIATDGCLSKDGRHIDITSKDLEQIETFKKLLKLNNSIGVKYARRDKLIKYHRLQFGNVLLYRFLLKVGLTPNKSKSIGPLKVPDKYFRDFLRGSLDGDGYTYSYWDPRWKNSFMLYTGFTSASFNYLEWMNGQVNRLYGINGKIKYGSRVHQLMFAKRASIVLLTKLYYKDHLPCLSRKYSKIMQALSIINKQADVAELVYAYD